MAERQHRICVADYRDGVLQKNESMVVCVVTRPVFFVYPVVGVNIRGAWLETPGEWTYLEMCVSAKKLLHMVSSGVSIMTRIIYFKHERLA